MTEQTTNDIRIIDEYGAMATVTDLRDKKFVAALTSEQLAELAYTVKNLKSPMKNVEDEIKKRLKDGTTFARISQSEVSKKTLPADDEKLKIAFVKKYGWDTVEVKTPKKLTDLFGKAIEEDLEKVVVYTPTTRVKYD